MIECSACGADNLNGIAYCDNCGEALAGANPSAPQAAPAAAAGVIAGRYRIERELGGGGQKQIHLAADLRLSNRLCALAELTPLARSQKDIAEGQATFRREAETLAALSNFHIVQIYDYFDEGGRCYLVEEYVRGQTLQQRIASRPRMALDEVVQIALQVLEALEYLHALTPPLLHRDLKPDNIILAPASGGGEVVKLIDFGIARHFQVQRGTVHGTPGYAAPEQYRGLPEPRTDLYALGGILHFALSGRDPQEHEPFSFPPLASIRPDLPHPLCLLVDQALSKEAGSRPASAAEFKTRLMAAIRNPAAPRPRPSGPQAPTIPLPPPAPASHSPMPSAPSASKIEWTPAQVEFAGVERGGTVDPVILTVRNTGRGTLEAQVTSDSPALLRITPRRIAENQAQLQVGVDTSAVNWGHRYRANINLVLDHSGATVAIPVVVRAADNQTVLAHLRSLTKMALFIAGGLALTGEIVLAQANLTISGTLRGATAAQVAQAADAIVTLGMLALVIAMVAANRRKRISTLIFGLIAIAYLHAKVAAIFVDYLMFPALAAGLAAGSALLLRRPCNRFLARQGLGIWPQLRALFLFMAAPAAAMAAAGAWLMTAASPATSVTINPWTPPPYVRRDEPPPPGTASSYAPSKPAFGPHEPAPRVAPPPERRRAAPPPGAVEAEIRKSLSASGFAGIGVSVEPSGRVYLSGRVEDLGQREEIENIVRGVAGVRGVVASLDAPKGWMGVTVVSGADGATVQYLMPHSPADRAGIVLNDVIADIDGESIRDYADFHRVLESKAAGQTITVTLRREDQTFIVTVRLRKKPIPGG